MKKRLLLFAFFCSMTTWANVGIQFPVTVLRIDFSVGLIKPKGLGDLKPRTPIHAPEAGLDGHTLYLAEGHPACTLLLMDADEEVVYEVDVPEGVDVVELPATLTGIYELQLYYEGSNFYFYSEIEL